MLVPLNFKLNVSFLYGLFLLIVSLLSVFVANVIQIAWAWRVLISTIILSYASYVLWQQVLLRGKRTVLILSQIAKREWLVTTREGQAIAELQKGCVATSWLFILHFKLISGRRYCAVIFKDALPPNDYRRLSVLLHHAN